MPTNTLVPMKTRKRRDGSKIIKLNLVVNSATNAVPCEADPFYADRVRYEFVTPQITACKNN